MPKILPPPPPAPTPPRALLLKRLGRNRRFNLIKILDRRFQIPSILHQTHARVLGVHPRPCGYLGNE